MALMTTSGSMPFSLASASMVCCSGLLITCLRGGRPLCRPRADTSVRPYKSKLHFQVRPCDHVDRDPVPASVFAVDEDDRAASAAFVHAAQPALEKLLAVDRLTYDHFRAPAGEPAVIVGRSERPVEAGRRNLESVRVGHDILDVEDR